MQCLREFKERLESDEAFREKFRGAKNENQLIDMAEAEGYDLTRLCDDDLDDVAGGKKTKEEMRDTWYLIQNVLNFFGW